MQAIAAIGDRVFEVSAGPRLWDVQMVIRVGDDLRTASVRTKTWVPFRYFETRDAARQQRNLVMLALSDGISVFALSDNGQPPMEISPRDFDVAWRMPQKFVVHERRRKIIA